MHTPLITCTGITKTYGDLHAIRTAALCGVDCVIHAGEFVAIMGPSGSGKSTLMQILGLLDRPTGGTYFLEGHDTALLDDDTAALLRNQRFGFIFQSFNLLPRVSVADNVALPLLYDRRARSIEDAVRVADVLATVGLTQRASYAPNQLSGGEQQRVAIARALINDPAVVFADEPTGNLDSKSGLAVMRVLQELHARGKTIVLVTHETATAEHAQRIIAMRDGVIVDDAPVTQRRDATEEQELK